MGRRRWGLALSARWLPLVLTVSLAACRKEEAPKPRTEPWLNPAYGALSAPSIGSATPAGALLEYELSPEASRITFSLPAKGGNPRGRLVRANGTLKYSPGNLGQSRAELLFDLTSIELEPWEDASTPHDALEWLELGAEVPQATRELHRYARFSLSSLNGFGELVGPRRRAGGTARGELALHGFRVAHELLLEVEARGEELIVRTKRPVTIALAEHDIAPRGPRGELRAQDLALIGTKVGKAIKVDCELVFRPASD